MKNDLLFPCDEIFISMKLIPRAVSRSVIKYETLTETGNRKANNSRADMFMRDKQSLNTVKNLLQTILDEFSFI